MIQDYKGLFMRKFFALILLIVAFTPMFLVLPHFDEMKHPLAIIFPFFWMLGFYHLSTKLYRFFDRSKIQSNE